MNTFDITGSWSIGGMEVTIVLTEAGLALRHPEAPPGCDSPIRSTSEGRFTIESGPFAGAELHFESGGGSRPTGTVAGSITVDPLDREARAAPGSGLIAPPMVLDRPEVEAFERVWSAAKDDGHVTTLDLVAPPRHRFVQWLTAREEVIFHGSNVPAIEEFKPIRRSMEIRNESGRGNLGAVYGTHDGLWAMFFAIIDRARLEGSIRNGVTHFHTHYGSPLDVYQFSIHHELLAAEPYANGTLYMLPREAFERLPIYPGGPPSNEWACPTEVAPLAKLTVDPGDFPFLESIGGHDDGDLIRFNRLGKAVYEGIVEAAPIDGGFELVTNADSDLVDRFIELSRRFYPDVERTAIRQPDGIRVIMTGPPAFVHGLEERLRDHLDHE